MVGQKLEGREILCSVIVIMSINQCISATGNNKFDMVMNGWLRSLRAAGAAGCTSRLPPGPCGIPGLQQWGGGLRAAGLTAAGGEPRCGAVRCGTAGRRRRDSNPGPEAPGRGRAGPSPRGLITAFQHDVIGGEPMIAREGRDVGGPAANSGGGGAEPRQWWNAAAAAAVRVGAAQVWRRGALRGAAGRGGFGAGLSGISRRAGAEPSGGEPRGRGHVHLPAGERGGLLRDGGRAGQVSGADGRGRRVQRPPPGAPPRLRGGSRRESRTAVALRGASGTARRCGPYMAPRERDAARRQRGGAVRGGGG